MKIQDGYVLREIAGQFMAIPIGSRVKDLHGLIALNETGAFLWKLLSSKDCDIYYLTNSLTSEYDVTDSDAQTAVTGFIEMLNQEKLLENNV